MSFQIRATFLLGIVFFVVVNSYAAQISAIIIGSSFQKDRITIYDDVNAGGASYYLDLSYSYCTNIPSDWNDRISSINTYGNCAIGYEHSDCRGRGERFAPGTPHHGDLTNLDFNDQITSFKRC
ncbi:unnamed protein product [Orchesella dallaii]|uniref:Beta/gamma crystallin 'Greek key' domain-containing protein n=1 Tax=Orchesella dallaii TaxID=48710 RepID=A0ABP1RT56_9HEXA